jgi:RNA polymerase sigma factor (sigma-70 family)
LPSTEDKDLEFFGRLWTTHCDRLAKACYYIAGGNQAEADDIFQEAFALAWLKKIASQRDGDGAYRWLYYTARNFAYKAWRDHRRYIPVGIDKLVERPAEVHPPVAFRFDIYSYIRRLKPHDREVLLLTVSEASETEIAAELGIKIGTMRVRRHRAMGRLRTLLKRDGYTEFNDCLIFDGKEMSNA